MRLPQRGQVILSPDVRHEEERRAHRLDLRAMRNAYVLSIAALAVALLIVAADYIDYAAGGKGLGYFVPSALPLIVVGWATGLFYFKISPDRAVRNLLARDLAIELFPGHTLGYYLMAEARISDVVPASQQSDVRRQVYKAIVLMEAIEHNMLQATGEHVQLHTYAGEYQKLKALMQDADNYIASRIGQ